MNRRIEPAHEDESRGQYADVRRAYAELGDEPVPPVLDARVLDRARAAVRPARARPRWLVPASLAASVVLAVGVALDVRREAHDERAVESAVVSSEVAAPDAAVGAAADLAVVDANGDVRDADAASAAAAAPGASAAKQRAARERATGNASEARVSVPADLPAAAAPGLPPRPSEPFVAAPPAEAAAPAVAAAPARAAATDGAAVITGEQSARAATAHESAVVQRRATPPVAAATAPALSRSESADAAGTAALATPAPPPPLAPEDWLAKIEALRRAGRTAEADAELARFVRTYPDYLPVVAPR
jgi:Meckel syndrome type 1 protein